MIELLVHHYNVTWPEKNIIMVSYRTKPGAVSRLDLFNGDCCIRE